MDDQKVTEVRQQLLDTADCVMGARRLAGLLSLAGVSVESVRSKLRAADGLLDEAWMMLLDEDGGPGLLVVLALGVVALVVVAGLGWN